MPTSTSVAFKKGLFANLPATKTAGQFLVATDTKELFLDVDESTRIRLGDFEVFADLAALNDNPHPSADKLYYITALNVLARYNGTSYTQINVNTDTQYKLEQDSTDGHILHLSHKALADANWTSDGDITIPDTDTGATSVEATGDGNAVTGASYDAATRKITLTKGASYAAASFVGEIPDGATANTVTGYAKELADAVLGTSGDAATANTVYGAKAAAAAAKAEAEAKVASVDATANKGITVDNTDAKNPKIGVKLSEKVGNQLGFADGDGEDGGLYFKAADADAYAIEKLATAEEGYAASYRLTKNGSQAGATINIPKDMVVQSGEVVTNPEGKPAGTYIKLVLANATNDEIYINVSDLIEYVTSGSQAGDMVVIAIDETTHKVTATITDGTVTEAKLVTELQTKINTAASKASANETAIDNIKNGEDIDSFGDVETALAGKQDTIAANTYDAYGAAATAKSEVIGASTDAKTADTINGAKAFATDAATTAQTNAVNTVVGADTDTKDSDTVKGAKLYADSVMAAGLAWGSF